MNIIQASFFWQNDKPGGIDITFGPPGFSPQDLGRMFSEDTVKGFMRTNDAMLGSLIVNDMINQLTIIGNAVRQGERIGNRRAIQAALNIMWLSERGFIPKDEFNGVQFIGAMA